MPNRQCFGQTGRDGRRSPYKRRAAAAAVSIRSPDVLETVSWLSVDSVSGRPDGLNAYASGEVSAPGQRRPALPFQSGWHLTAFVAMPSPATKKGPRTEPFSFVPRIPSLLFRSLTFTKFSNPLRQRPAFPEPTRNAPMNCHHRPASQKEQVSLTILPLTVSAASA